MQDLLRRKKYNPGKRPSEHHISETSFFNDHGGSIMPNFFDLKLNEENRLPENVLRFSNTASNDFYTRSCKEQNIKPHPARMNPGVAAFFIDFLTDPGDIILDPFAGSNTTGYVAEKLGRNWISIDIKEEYGIHSKIRLSDPNL
jgi:site-specific DNA-methyltransferase (cytosine-N4-specific)